MTPRGSGSYERGGLITSSSHSAKMRIAAFIVCLSVMASSVAAFAPLGATILAPPTARGGFCSDAGAPRTSRVRIGLVKLACAAGDAGAGDGEARLMGLPRAELQALAKVHGLKANAKSSWLVAELLKAGVRPEDSPTSPLEAAPSPVSETAPPSEDVHAARMRVVTSLISRLVL
jgi:hypothetical protein